MLIKTQIMDRISMDRLRVIQHNNSSSSKFQTDKNSNSMDTVPRFNRNNLNKVHLNKKKLKIHPLSLKSG